MRRLSSFRPVHEGGRKLFNIAEIAIALKEQNDEQTLSDDRKIVRGSAVKSVKKGTAHWRAILKPFVSNLAFRCVKKRRAETGVSFHAWSGHAACLFVDISGYSKVTAALANKGAYALSSVVNNYMDQILRVVELHGGDVVKFAGDAVFIVWEGSKESLRDNVLCAALCAQDLQEKAGHFPVEGTNLVFRIHTGMSCGQLDTEIFEAPQHMNMQRLYHAVSGAPVMEMENLVDVAKAGQTCISGDCVALLGDYAKVELVDIQKDASIMHHIELPHKVQKSLANHLDNLIKDRERVRNDQIEEDFVHPAILQLLLHSGNKSTQIAQMRNLCVFFIAMTSNGNAVNWLQEVQGVLDARRCPIVQIIDDDKGVHVIAALNLHESVSEAATVSLDICRDLVEKKVGCAIGLALGSTFCGVTGSHQIACRWDITGPPPVRAARLMQYAVAENLQVAIDQSIYDGTPFSSRMELHADSVKLKGSKSPVSVFKLSKNTVFVASMIMESMMLAPVHTSTVDQICSYLSGPKQRGAIVITGPSLSGKKSVFQQAAGLARGVPVLHTSDVGGGHLQLAYTMATWYSSFSDPDIRKLAEAIKDDMEHQRWSRAHDETVTMTRLVIHRGYRSYFVIDRCQYLDDFSMSLVRECISGGYGRKKKCSLNLSLESLNSTSVTNFDEGRHEQGDVVGRLFFLFAHVPLYNSRNANEFAKHIKRTRSFDIPVFEIGPVKLEEIRRCFQFSFDCDATDSWFQIYGQHSGYFIGYFYERVKALRTLTVSYLNRGKTGLVGMNSGLKVFIPPSMVSVQTGINVMQINPDAGMRFSQGFDDLPPKYQLFMKILTIAARHAFDCRIPISVLKSVINDLIVDGIAPVKFAIMIDELSEVYMIRVDRNQNIEPAVFLLCPAIGDVIVDICTPSQISGISEALLQHFAARMESSSYKVQLVCATLNAYLGRHDEERRLYQEGYESMKKEAETNQWTQEDLTIRTNAIVEHLVNEEQDVEAILGRNPSTWHEDHDQLSFPFMFLRDYSLPITFGPLGHTLNVITRNVFREAREFSADGAQEDEIYQRRQDSRTAKNRYRSELRTIESFLEHRGYSQTERTIERELELIEFLAKPGESLQCLQTKTSKIYDVLIPEFLEPRMKRLYSVAEELFHGPTPQLFKKATQPIRLAWEAMKAADNRADAGQAAIVVLAAMNWSPDVLPESLPLFHYQTVARLRNATMRRLKAAELAIFRHQHSVRDLEGFLICTALLDS